MRTKKQTSQWWWLDSKSATRRSPWLQSTLSELDDKTEAMLKLIEGDADSFAQRAEMYYRKRPELTSMVEDFYRTYRLLAERYDQLKSESGTRLLTTIGSPFSSNKFHIRKAITDIDENCDSHSENFELGSPFSCNKYRHEKLTSMIDQNYDSYSDTFEHEENAESEVEDPEEEDRIIELKCQKNDTRVPEEKGGPMWQVVVNEKAEEEPKSRPSGVSDDEAKKLREEIERLKEENRMQMDLLFQKDEEKREVIRQLSLSMGVLKDENMVLRKRVARDSKWNPFEFNKMKVGFIGKLFNGSSAQSNKVVAL